MVVGKDTITHKEEGSINKLSVEPVADPRCSFVTNVMKGINTVKICL